jgi:putative membrane protein
MLAATAAEPWRFQAHIEVWLLVAFLVVAYVYMVRVLGPKAVGPGEAVITGRQKIAFVAGIAILWFASDWPVHDIAEEYLYSVHMFQHMSLTYFMPPLVVLATPEWFARTLVGNGGFYRFVKFMAHPVRAAFFFNVAVMVSHVPGVVNASVSNGTLHYGVHVFLVTSAILMWLPVCGPFKEMHIGYMGQMIYLFMNSVVATVPAGWLTFAEGVVYKHYNIPWRVWGISVTDDQQIAGAIMKIGGAVFLWGIIIVMFINKFVKTFRAENEGAYVRQPLTMADVEKAFEESEPIRETERH